ncbi:MAG: cell division protein FtsL [Negativicutes bacterium]
MTRLRRRKQPALTENTERCSGPKTHRCLRTDCLVSAIILGLLALFATWGSSAIVQAGYELVQARASLTRLEKQNELLHLDLVRLKAPQRIQAIALGELGLVKPPAVYMAAKTSPGGKAGQEEKQELIAGQRSILFGDSRAEAHTADDDDNN